LQRFISDSLLRNSAFIMATTVVTGGLGFVYWTVAARTLAPHEVGLASALISAMVLTSEIANLGLDVTLVQVLPRQAPGQDWSAALNGVLATGVLAGFVSAVIVTFVLPELIPEFEPLRSRLLFGLSFVLGVPLTTTGRLLDAVFTAERSTVNRFLRNTVFAVIKIPPVLLGPLVAHGSGTAVVFSTWVLATLVTVVLSLPLVRRLGRGYVFVMRGAVHEFYALWSLTVANHFTNLGGRLPMYLLPIFVTARRSPEDNAYFFTTWTLGSLFFLVSPAVATSLLAEGIHQPGQLRGKVRRSAIVISVLLIPMMVVCLVGGRLILSIFGQDYARAGYGLFALLVLSAVPDAVTSLYVSIRRVERRVREVALLNLSMSGISLMVGWLMLPAMGIAACGLAWLLAQSAGSCYVLSRWIGAAQTSRQQRRGD